MSKKELQINIGVTALVKAEWYVRLGIGRELNYHYQVVKSPRTTEVGKRHHLGKIKEILKEAVFIFSDFNRESPEHRNHEIRQCVNIAIATLGR